jgi:serine protease Do
VLGTDGTKASYCQILRSHKSIDTLTLNVLRWKTQEILEGQLNGRQLAVTGTFGSATASNNTQKSATATVSDDSNVITMVIPSDWQYDGSAWENSWNINGKSYPFTAQTLAVAPDVKAYGSGWNMRGLFIATSRDWASMGGYANLLEGVTASGYKDCQPKGGALPYKDDTYEGQIVTYNRCGTKQTAALVMAIRPINTPQAYLVLIEMKFATDADVNELDAIMASANINP